MSTLKKKKKKKKKIELEGESPTSDHEKGRDKLRACVSDLIRPSISVVSYFMRQCKTCAITVASKAR